MLTTKSQVSFLEPSCTAAKYITESDVLASIARTNLSKAFNFTGRPWIDSTGTESSWYTFPVNFEVDYIGISYIP